MAEELLKRQKKLQELHTKLNRSSTLSPRIDPRADEPIRVHPIKHSISGDINPLTPQITPDNSPLNSPDSSRLNKSQSYSDLSSSNSSISLMPPATIENITSFLSTQLMYFQNNFVSVPVAIEFFAELYRRANVSLFNELIKKSRYCNWTNAIEMKLKLQELITWIRQESEWLAGTHTQFSVLEQAIGLIMFKKYTLEDTNLIKSMCNKLNAEQIYYLIKHYTPAEKEAPIPDLILKLYDTGNSPRDENILLKEDMSLNIASKNLHSIEMTGLDLIPFPDWAINEIKGTLGKLRERNKGRDVASVGVPIPPQTQTNKTS